MNLVERRSKNHQAPPPPACYLTLRSPSNYSSSNPQTTTLNGFLHLHPFHPLRHPAGASPRPRRGGGRWKHWRLRRLLHDRLIRSSPQCATSITLPLLSASCLLNSAALSSLSHSSSCNPPSHPRRQRPSSLRKQKNPKSLSPALASKTQTQSNVLLHDPFFTSYLRRYLK
ncbi:hypothetical protein BKA70DRAFT_345049 [Coprinopsis sp. MPI-PUGE-AT-0042]|nr:hypothetical protein BKA70DRAFT_345049 [Coprinopsis sp. MPI-PUGE-AT-0042]